MSGKCQTNVRQIGSCNHLGSLQQHHMSFGQDILHLYWILHVYYISCTLYDVIQNDIHTGYSTYTETQNYGILCSKSSQLFIFNSWDFIFSMLIQLKCFLWEIFRIFIQSVIFFHQRAKYVKQKFIFSTKRHFIYFYTIYYSHFYLNPV